MLLENINYLQIIFICGVASGMIIQSFAFVIVIWGTKVIVTAKLKLRINTNATA